MLSVDVALGVDMEYQKSCVPDGQETEMKGIVEEIQNVQRYIPSNFESKERGVIMVGEGGGGEW